jgi:hypothetical protein
MASSLVFCMSFPAYKEILMADAPRRSRFGQAAVVFLGIAAGSAVAGIFFLHDWMGRPRYTARIPFCIASSQMRLGADPPRQSMSGDDVGRLLRLQMALFDEEVFLNEVLRSEDFHPADPANPEKHLDCKWLAANRDDPINALRRDLLIVPRMEAGTFDLTMTDEDRNEAVVLATGAAKVYLGFLREMHARSGAAAMDNMEKVLREVESEYNYKAGEVSDFARQKGIDGTGSRLETENRRLQTLTDDYERYDAACQSAQQRFEILERMRKQGMEIQLSPESDEQVENDPTLRAVQLSRLTLEQDLAVETAKSPVVQGKIREVQVRLEEVDRQIAAIRKRLHEAAFNHLYESASTNAANTRFLVAYVADKRTAQEMLVHQLGQEVIAFQRKMDDLKELQSLLNKMRTQLEVEKANRFSDDMQIEQIAELPATPKEPVVPQWYRYFPFGAAGGLLFSGLAELALSARHRIRRTKDDLPHS